MFWPHDCADGDGIVCMGDGGMVCVDGDICGRGDGGCGRGEKIFAPTMSRASTNNTFMDFFQYREKKHHLFP